MSGNPTVNLKSLHHGLERAAPAPRFRAVPGAGGHADHARPVFLREPTACTHETRLDGAGPAGHHLPNARPPAGSALEPHLAYGRSEVANA